MKTYNTSTEESIGKSVSWKLHACDRVPSEWIYWSARNMGVPETDVVISNLCLYNGFMQNAIQEQKAYKAEYIRNPH